MALINCSECGQQLSDKAAFCPHCGAPVVIQPPEEPKMICEECGNEISSDAKTCPNCGAPIAQTEETHAETAPIIEKPTERQKFCAKCGTAMPESAMFCPKCGASSAPSAAAPQQAATATYDPDPHSGGHKAAGLIAVILMVLAALGFGFADTIIIKPLNTVTQLIGKETSLSAVKFMSDSEKWAERLQSIGLLNNNDVFSIQNTISSMFIFSELAAFLLLISLLEFFTPRKNDTKYLVKVRRGWIIMAFVSIMYIALGCCVINMFMNDQIIHAAFDLNTLFYVCFAAAVAMFIMSIIMISIYNSLRKEYISQTPEHKEYLRQLSIFRANALNRTIFDPYNAKNGLFFVVCIILNVISFVLFISSGLSDIAREIVFVTAMIFAVLTSWAAKRYTSSKFNDPKFTKRRRSSWIIMTVSSVSRFITFSVCDFASLLNDKKTDFVLSLIIDCLLTVFIIAASIYSINLCSKYIKRDKLNAQQN